MLALLAGILPFAVGAAVTPTILLAQLRNVDGPGGSLRKGAAYAAGCAAVLLGVSALSLALAAGTGGAASSPTAIAIVELSMAAALAGFGLWSGRSRSEVDARRPRHVGRLRDFGLGIGMMATNFTSLILYFPAMHLVGVSRSGTAGKIVAFMVLFGATMLPATAPLLPSGRLAAAVRSRLERANAFFDLHRRTLVPLLAFTFAAYLGVQGLVNLL
jgi:hypothetical protein